MISPTSTFYDPDNVSAGQDVNGYQNWLQSFGDQQQPTFHHQPQIPPAVQNPYHFVPGQYSPPNSSTIGIASSDYTDTQNQQNFNQTNMNSMRGPYRRPPELYFYNHDLMPDQSHIQSHNIPYKQYSHSPGTTPSSASSFISPSSTATYTPGMATAGTTGSSSFTSGAYAPSPDLLSLPSAGLSHSHSSVSPTSWKDDAANSTPGSVSASIPSHGSSIPSSTPVVSRSMHGTTTTGKRTAKPSASSAAGPARGKRKRQKKNDVDRDSETGSDEEPENFETGNFPPAVGGTGGSMGGPEPVIPTRL